MLKGLEESWETWVMNGTQLFSLRLHFLSHPSPALTHILMQQKCDKKLKCIQVVSDAKWSLTTGWHQLDSLQPWGQRREGEGDQEQGGNILRFGYAMGKSRHFVEGGEFNAYLLHDSSLQGFGCSVHRKCVFFLFATNVFSTIARVPHLSIMCSYYCLFSTTPWTAENDWKAGCADDAWCFFHSQIFFASHFVSHFPIQSQIHKASGERTEQDTGLLTKKVKNGRYKQGKNLNLISTERKTQTWTDGITYLVLPLRKPRQTGNEPVQSLRAEDGSGYRGRDEERGSRTGRVEAEVTA